MLPRPSNAPTERFALIPIFGLTAPAPPLRRKTGKPTILVVSRDRGETAFLKHVLAKLNLNALEAATEETAVNLYGECQAEVSLVLLGTGDLGLNSAKVLAQLRAMDPAVRHCFIVDQRKAERIGEVCLRRPLTAPNVLAALRELLHSNR